MRAQLLALRAAKSNRYCLRNIPTRKSQPFRVDFYTAIAHQMWAWLHAFRSAKSNRSCLRNGTTRNNLPNCGLTSIMSLPIRRGHHHLYFAQPNVNRLGLRSMKARNSHPMRVDFKNVIAHQMWASSLMLRSAPSKSGLLAKCHRKKASIIG